MMCYRDRSYCRSEGCTNACGRKITPLEKKEALELDIPVCYGLFCEEISLEALNRHIDLAFKNSAPE